MEGLIFGILRYPKYLKFLLHFWSYNNSLIITVYLQGIGNRAQSNSNRSIDFDWVR